MSSRRRGRPDDEPLPLGSFSRPSFGGAPGSQACPRCGRTDLTRIEMGLPDGRPGTFVSCTGCETTAWFAADGDGSPLRLDGTPLDLPDRG
ncbi:hypothetical protein [Cellulomonas sp. SLBN-39]|uniref:hypothetical protein n=1 Tax=Cellulomonas sp. SLBN-39 TaxID=2768446 RepID=UPI00114DECC2|nr:hypothetical protein [Cellulomonas sp. SLBN-39]TQL03696.1 hypothetical protein FBY24_2797 [Cellulomonas sp. SLBN-39]